MGTTLQNGVYLPNEGERNCYAGLKTNWEILDQKVADVTALQQAVAGALHREIVESLPTTDIDPNTIYMILSGTSATENVYNEFMYVNNAWELIGTSATDLTNYYTKGDVDGLLLLKANASDLTSHTGDTTIHVTASDKAKWTNSANTHVLRLALSALTPSTSDNSFSNLDDSTALKVGDKVMDTAGVLFEVTAIDTQNSTFTIGTALIDLLSSDLFNSANTWTGNNEFSAPCKTLGKKLLTDITDLDDAYYNGEVCEFTPNTLHNPIGDYGNVLTINNAVNTPDNIYSSWITQIATNAGGGYLGVRNRSNGGAWTSWTRILTEDHAVPTVTNTYDLGTSTNKWKSVYATNYYYGANNVEFSTKFVTTDTAQAITGNKTFSSNVNVYNSDATATTPNLYLRSSKIELSSQGNTSGDQNLAYADKNNTNYAYIKGAIQSNGSAVKIRAIAKDSSDNSVINELQMLAYTNGSKAIFPTYSNEVDLGVSSYKWKSFNGVEPSSLSLPSGNVSDVIDISSYITDLSGGVNLYTVPANGYLSFTFSSGARVQIYPISGGGVSSSWVSGSSAGIIRGFMPVLKNSVLRIVINATTMESFYFIPCQGNI